MDTITVAQENHLFYYIAVPRAMFSEMLFQAVLSKLGDAAQIGIEQDDFSGYLKVDTSAIPEKSLSRFRDAMTTDESIVSRVAFKIPGAISGELNDTCAVTIDVFTFNFKITRYERDRAHEFRMIEDPGELEAIPENERLGRFVELKVTVAT